MLQIKFDQDWPTGFRDIQVWKYGRRTTTDDDGPLVYYNKYKLTLWAFGSGELKCMKETLLGMVMSEREWSFIHFSTVTL